MVGTRRCGRRLYVGYEGGILVGGVVLMHRGGESAVYLRGWCNAEGVMAANSIAGF